jgi:PAS domain S-box-containing protein
MPPARRLALLALLTTVYVLAGRFGLSLAFVNESATAVWPPTGIAIAAGLLGGPSLWPAVLAGAFLVNLANTGAFGPSLVIAAGNTAEMLVATWLAVRFAGGAAAFRTTTNILIYVAAASVAAAVAATVGLAALLLGDLAGNVGHATVWWTWWTGDLSGALLVTPALVTWADLDRNPWPWPRPRMVEGVLLLANLAAAGYWVFGPTPAGVRGYPMMFVILPTLLWAAVRFGLRGATLAMLVTAGIATAGTLAGFGPFVRGNPNESLLLLQAYLCVKVVVMLSLATEVSARKRVEREIRLLNADLSRRVDARSEELRRLHGRLVEAQEVAHIGSWEWDVADNSIWWSDEMYRVYGLPVGEPVTYERYISMVHAEDRAMVQEIVSRSGRTGEPFTFEHRAVTPDGTVRRLHSRGRIIRDADGRPIRMLGVGHDITELKRAEEERIELVREQAARREAEEASRMKDYFLATLSHELRTPLNAIVGWARMLKDHALDDALRHRAIDAIQRNVTVQAQLVSDILDVARIRSGTLSIDPRPVLMQAILGGALDILRPMVESKGIEIVVSVPEAAAVVGDEQRLQQVFWNLLSNAAKFSPAGGRIHVHASHDASADVIEVSVEDNGPGIAEDFLPHVFEQFKQADPSLTREHGGLGLGLAISHNLVQLHGGTIAAANSPRGGAVFTVRLPAAAVQSAM